MEKKNSLEKMRRAMRTYPEPPKVYSPPPKTACMDCEKPYSDFGLDMVFPRAQWLLIHPNEGGLLCGNCMIARAAKIPRATVVHAVIEVAPKNETEPNYDYHRGFMDAPKEKETPPSEEQS